MKQECRCGDNCRTCNTCQQPKCECYCEYYFEDVDDMSTGHTRPKSKGDELSEYDYD